MNVGSDYLLFRLLRRRRRPQIIGVVALVLGVVLLLTSGSYYWYSQQARSSLDTLVVQVPVESITPEVVLPGLDIPQEDLPTPTSTLDGSEPPTPVPPVIPSERFETLYPGQGLHPRYWTNVLWAEAPDTLEIVGLLDGFRPINSSDLRIKGSSEPITRIQIPIIEIDSSVEELELLNLGDAFAWETPKNIVGHIPTTATAGEVGRGYLFGHLESLIRGEGNVFTRLPEIPNLLREGEQVYIILSRDDGTRYLYKVFSTQVVYKDDLALIEGESPVMTLVTCVPRLVYDHRLLVDAAFVGVENT